MPFVVTSDPTPEAADLHFLVAAGGCQLKPYTKLKTIRSISVSGRLIAYASPDSTYAVTRRLLDDAKKEIMIGIYDFSADYVKEILLNAMRRGVKVTLMLDINSPAEKDLLVELEQFGGQTVAAPSCSNSNREVRYFPNAHQKIIVIDRTWTLIQSGNFSRNSIPFNEVDGGDPNSFVTGNRDMGIAMESKAVAEFFRKLLLSDMKLVTDAQQTESLLTMMAAVSPVPDLVEAAPQVLPVKLFPSKTFTPTTPVNVKPVLTPDNYLSVLPGLIGAATKSILIENQYIRGSQAEVGKLLTAIKKAKDKTPTLDVRIVLGKLFGAADVPKEKQNVETLKTQFSLVLDKNIRYIDTTRFVHCHNKLVIIDGTTTLISSQNWSDTGVSTNREAGVVVEDPAIAQYYTEIFESDWSTAQKKVPTPGAPTIMPEALSTGRFVTVTAADYQEV